MYKLGRLLQCLLSLQVVFSVLPEREMLQWTNKIKANQNKCDV